MYFQTLIAQTDIFTWILVGITGLAFLLQTYIYLFVYLKVAGKSKSPSEQASVQPVSVIICARNEEEHLRNFLPAVLEQDYPEYEVVVVDDCSTDDTAILLAELAAKYRHFRYTTITPDRKFTHGKKLALTVGIKSARHEIVLLTDADCVPSSDKWISGMVSGFGADTGMVLGYGRYERRKGLLNLLIRYETTITAMRYLGYALRGYPVKGVRRNLAYRKELFFNNKGFAGHYHIASGDDDLFVNEVADKTKVNVVYGSACHTISVPKSTFSDWITQKKRHISAGKYYRKGAGFRIAADWFSSVFFYLPAIWLTASSGWTYITAGALALLSIIKMTVLKLNMRRLDEKDLLLPSLIIEPLFPYFLFVLKVVHVFDRKPNQWS